MRLVLAAIGLVIVAAVCWWVVGDTKGPVTPAVQAPSQEEAWVRSQPNAEDLTFEYPDPFLGKYVSTSQWPPHVETLPEYTCAENLSERVNEGRGDPVGGGEEEINGKTYCVTVWREGAAGSTFTTYEYMTAQGGEVLKVTFTMRFVQCANYDAPEMDMCAAEQAAFDVDTLATRMLSSVILP